MVDAFIKGNRDVDERKWSQIMWNISNMHSDKWGHQKGCILAGA